ncbi:MAG: helix-turn-helix domain-containing protein [Tatlockia sp.]|jgi:cytoskeleton protein RodZ
MNTTTIANEIHPIPEIKPGMQLAQHREKKGYSREYVAGKLHLRVQLIEHLEADDYSQMPEPVFIKGYLRAYAKLVDEPVEPLMEIFNKIYCPERKLEKTLWQSKRESNRWERFVRLSTGVIAVGALVAVGLLWHKNKDQSLFANKSTPALALEKPVKSDTELKLTDLSKMHSVLLPANEADSEESQGG